MYNIGTVLYLSDNCSYAVISNIIYEEKEYLYLVDINDNSNMIFALKNNDTLEIVHDTSLINKLILEMNKQVNNS